MKILRFFIEQYVFSLLFFLGIFIFGLVSFTQLKVEFMPVIDMQSLTIATLYESGSPEEIESLITRPIEDTLATVDGLTFTRSVSQDGWSVSELFFTWGSDMDRAIIDVRKNLDLVKNSLPQETGLPVIMRNSARKEGAMLIAVRNLGYSSKDFEQEVKRTVKDALKRQRGVGQVRIHGLAQSELQVELDSKKLVAAGLHASDITERIAKFNVDYPVGKVYDEVREYPVRIKARLENPAELGDIPVVYSKGRYQLLSQLASVQEVLKKEETYTKYNGERVTVLEIVKEARANTPQMCSEVSKAIDELSERYRGRLEFVTVYNQGSAVESSILSLLLSVLGGLAAAYGVLYFFYRSHLKSILILSTLPLSFLIIAMLMHLSRMSLNLMSLGGMALGSGMLLDSAILCLDTLTGRSFDKKIPLARQFSQRLSSIAGSVFSSNLCMLAVFLPIPFSDGLIASVFTDMALTISFSLIASAAVALTFLPAVLYVIVKNKKRMPVLADIIEQNRSAQSTRRVYSTVENFFIRTSTLLGRTPRMLFLSALFSLIPFLSIFILDKELLPYTELHKCTITVQLPAGTSLSKTESLEKEFTRQILDFAGEKSGDKNVVVISKAGRETDASLSYNDTSGANVFSLTVISKVSAKIIGGIASNAGEKQKEHGTALSVLVEYARPEFARFLYDAKDSRYVLATADRREEVTQWAKSRYEMENWNYEYADERVLRFDKVSGALLGLDPLAVARELYVRLQGDEENYLLVRDDALPIRVFASSLQNSQNALADEQIKSASEGGRPVTLRQCVTEEKTRRPVRLYRFQNRPAVYIPKDEIQNTRPETSQSSSAESPAVRFEKTVLAQELTRSAEEFAYSFLLSCFFIYLILSSQFNSFVKPLFVLATIVPAVSCALASLLFAGMPLTLFAGVGITMLAGASVNNAILIYEQIALHGDPIAAVKERVRVVTITVTAALVSLLPVLLSPGEGNEFNAVIAAVLFGGLIASVVFSLILIPAFFIRFKADTSAAVFNSGK